MTEYNKGGYECYYMLYNCNSVFFTFFAFHFGSRKHIWELWEPKEPTYQINLSLSQSDFSG